MKRIDKQAIEFLGSEGERFRRCSYDELASGISGSPTVASLASAEGLRMYRFKVTRAKLENGAIRVLLDGERSVLGGLGKTGCFDSFDKLPDDSVQEIEEGDEDYSGKD
jgi:hypothetical protein